MNTGTIQPVWSLRSSFTLFRHLGKDFKGLPLEEKQNPLDLNMHMCTQAEDETLPLDVAQVDVSDPYRPGLPLTFRCIWRSLMYTEYKLWPIS